MGQQSKHKEKKGWNEDFARVMKEKATTFFFTRFPDTWDEKTLWKLFSKYETVVDVFLAAKRTKVGTRFGFVRFIKVGTILAFEQKLGEICIGSFSILGEWKSEGIAKDCLERNKVNLSNWFSKLVMWKESIEPPGRLTWLEIEGLPALVWDPNAVHKIVKDIGTILELDDIKNSVGALIHTNVMEEINKCIPVRVNGRIYQIRILEDHNRYILLDIPKDSANDSCNEEYIDGSEDDESDGISETEFGRITKESFSSMKPLLRKEIVDVDVSLSCVAPTFEMAAEDVDDRGSINKTAETSNSKNMKTIDESNKVKKNKNKTLINGNPLSSTDDFQFRSESSPVGSTEAIKEEIGKTLGLIFEDDHQNVSREREQSGTLLMWDSGIFSKEEVLIGSHFIGVIGKWNGITENVAIINIYGHQGSNQKEKLWRALSSIINSKEAIGILLGDFNVVRTCEERLGSIFVERDARAFNEFIRNGGFHDFVMGGRRFTRFNREDPNSIFMAALDHFSSRFHEERPIRLKFRSDNFRRLDREDVIMLESAFTIEEVKAAVWDCSSSKSPGPDGFNFKFITRGLYIANEGVNISLLQYADDALFFGEWSKSNAVHLVHILSCLHDVSGLPIGRNLRKVEAWSEVIDRFSKRLATWKSKLLSIGGRLTLVKSVLGSLPLYYLSIFRAPKSVFSCLETITKRFFWGFKENEQKMIWVRWQTVLSDKKDGGLGVGSLKAKKHGASWQMEVAFSKR
nr:reverse transcriptase domain, reverse transcriptase zinc-binding domain protein [Tanacetum cinerariifolium]